MPPKGVRKVSKSETLEKLKIELPLSRKGTPSGTSKLGRSRETQKYRPKGDPKSKVDPRGAKSGPPRGQNGDIPGMGEPEVRMLWRLAKLVI